MTARGVDPKRLRVQGYGPDRPIVSNDTDQNRALNRRVQFVRLESEGAISAWTPAGGKPVRPIGSLAPNHGPLHEISTLVAEGKRDDALKKALSWHSESPADALAVVGLGTAFEAQGKDPEAARAYGSLIDLWPSNPAMRRYAGARLDRVALRSREALELAIDTYQRALADRPDHPSAHRLFAYALARAGRLAEAFEVITSWRRGHAPGDRFPGVERILAGDMGVIGAAWLRAAPDRRPMIEATLKAQGSALPTRPSLRFVLTWESDASDLDLHVGDGTGAEASHANTRLPSGGELYNDVTQGYGPEAFVIEGAARAHPYRIRVHMANRGATGYGLGKVEIIEHDGAGRLTFDERPFVVMNDGAAVDLGAFEPHARPR